MFQNDLFRSLFIWKLFFSVNTIHLLNKMMWNRRKIWRQMLFLIEGSHVMCWGTEPFDSLPLRNLWRMNFWSSVTLPYLPVILSFYNISENVTKGLWERVLGSFVLWSSDIHTPWDLSSWHHPKPHPWYHGCVGGVILFLERGYFFIPTVNTVKSFSYLYI